MIFKNKTKLAIIFIIFLTLFFFISKTIGNEDYPIAQKLKVLFPNKKKTLKNSVFIFSIINNKNNEQDAEIIKTICKNSRGQNIRN